MFCFLDKAFSFDAVIRTYLVYTQERGRLISGSYDCCRSRRIELTLHNPLRATRGIPHGVASRFWCYGCLHGRRKPGVLRPGVVGDTRFYGQHTTNCGHA